MLQLEAIFVVVVFAVVVSIVVVFIVIVFNLIVFIFFLLLLPLLSLFRLVSTEYKDFSRIWKHNYQQRCTMVAALWSMLQLKAIDEG